MRQDVTVCILELCAASGGRSLSDEPGDYSLRVGRLVRVCVPRGIHSGIFNSWFPCL